MSAIEDVISEFNNMCGESSTEMGDEARAELERYRAVKKAAQDIVNADVLTGKLIKALAAELESKDEN